MDAQCVVLIRPQGVAIHRGHRMTLLVAVLGAGIYFPASTGRMEIGELRMKIYFLLLRWKPVFSKSTIWHQISFVIMLIVATEEKVLTRQELK